MGWMALEPQIIRNLLIDNLPDELRTLSPDRLSLVINEVRNVARGYATAGSDAIAVSADHYRSLRQTGFAAMAVLCLSIAAAGLTYARHHLTVNLRTRNSVECTVTISLIICSCIAILTTIGIILSLIFESLRFFDSVPFWQFLGGLTWSPQMATRADQVGSSGGFGAVPLFTGTMLISGIALLIAVPFGLMSAIYMSEYANPRFRSIVKPLLEMLAGIPTVVYGFFAVLTVAPMIREFGMSLGMEVAAESALAAGIVMGIMIIPFVSSLSDDVINAVPQSLREGAYGLGSTKAECIQKVVLPAALPGVVGAILLAASRAIGETMIVVMAAGLSANLTANPFHAVTTVTVQIVTLLVGDSEFDSPKTLAAFALGLTLFCVTLTLNVIAQAIVNRFREKYD